MAPPRKGKNSRAPGYYSRSSLQNQQKALQKHHNLFHRARSSHGSLRRFMPRKWSLDACAGRARLHKLFPTDEMICTHIRMKSCAISKMQGLSYDRISLYLGHNIEGKNRKRHRRKYSAMPLHIVSSLLFRML